MFEFQRTNNVDQDIQLEQLFTNLVAKKFTAKELAEIKENMSELDHFGKIFSEAVYTLGYKSHPSGYSYFLVD